MERTFLPSGIAFNSISTFACASTSAEADMLTRKSACRCRCQPLYSLHILPTSIRPINPFCMQLSIPTLNRCLRPRRGQQSHSPDHEIRKRLIRRLAPLTHIFPETRYLGRRIVILIFEGGIDFSRLVEFASSAFQDVGFGSPLLRCGERT